MSDAKTCSSCGCELPADAPAGLCPKCLLAAGFESGPIGGPHLAATTPSPAGPAMRFVAPSLDELNRRLPQYEFLELLGQGGMGAVYKARQKGLDRLVAVKILSAEISGDAAFAERFAREARALARLSHPNIVAVYDFGAAKTPVADASGSPGDSLFYIAMEYVDGVNLRQAIRAKHMSPEQALAVVPQICDALQFAHDEGVVHRDIKPENILVDKRGRVKIADFGLAKIMSGGRESPGHEAALTGTHQVMGTLRYMAPEQLEGSHDVDHRADIYSLGVVFYELLTGELPIGRFAPPSKKVQIDVRLDEVVLRALEKEPELRWQHASDVRMEVTAIVGSSGNIIRMLPATATGREYRSRATLFGLPLLHIAYGFDPLTGKKRVAKGIVAMGDVAHGVIALGGTACGVVSFGGVAIGLISFGGVSLGLLLAIGGLAIGGAAWGGLACGAVAIGGMAAGGYCFGGIGFGVSVLTMNAQDAAAKAFFEPWAYEWPKWMTGLCISIALISAVQFIAAAWFLRNHGAAAPPPTSLTKPNARFSRAAIVGAVWAPCVLLLLGMVVSTTLVAYEARGDAPPPSGPPWWVIVLAVLAGLIGLAAPFATTILGFVSIGQIRRSEGKLYGLPLAVADVLLFPLLLLDGLILIIVAAVARGILTTMMPHGPSSSFGMNLPEILTLSIALPLIAWVDYRIVRAVWRAATGTDSVTAEKAAAARHVR